MTPPRVPRFGRTTRWFHWTFALSFLCLAATGALLLGRAELGIAAANVQSLIEIHKLTAVVFLTAPWLIGLSGDRRAWLRDLAETARLGRDDLIWLARQPLAMLGRAELPPQHKLNAGQKLNALAVAAISGAMTVTGIHLWNEPGSFLALVVHVSGFLAWLPAIAVHLFMALVNPSTRHALRAMVVGDVDRAWAAHHHARWLESVESGEPDEKTP
jgi:formate dehydrogenase gamma subunit